jgi:hypothetical protein
MRFLLAVLLTTAVSCSTIEDDRICIDWESSVIVQQKCIPYYGTLICADEEKVRTWCVLYEELEPLKEEE